MKPETEAELVHELQVIQSFLESGQPEKARGYLAGTLMAYWGIETFEKQPVS